MATLQERGFFWWFEGDGTVVNSKPQSIPGLLTISDEGRITLEMDGALCLEQVRPDWREPWIVSGRVTGQLTSGKWILLDDLERTDFSVADDSPQRQSFSAKVCIERDSKFPIKTVLEEAIALRIELEAFEDWLGLGSILVERDYEADEGVMGAELRYKEHKIQSETTEGVLSVESITTGLPFYFLGKHPSSDLHIRQNFYLVFTPKQSESWPSFRYTFTLLEDFLALLMGLHNRLSWPVLSSKEDSFEPWNSIYFDRGIPPTREINRYSIWIPFHEIAKSIGPLFSAWQSGYETYGPGYYLYLASLRNPHTYSEDRFLNLIGGIESLHRKWIGDPEHSAHVIEGRKRTARILEQLGQSSEDRDWLKGKLAYAHEMSLKMRIVECFQHLPVTFAQGQLEKFAATCANRRNDIAHAGGPRGMDYDSFHEEISRLASALDHLLHALLLLQIGVDRDLIAKTMTNSLVSHRIKAALDDVGLAFS
jgi:ApeA N-terminal domain 1